MYALFFISEGIVVQVPVPNLTSVIGIFYRHNVLSAVKRHYSTVYPRRTVLPAKGVFLLHDNAPVHKSALVKEYLAQNQIKTLPHPPYSPDLAPCDFWLNPYIKACLRGRRFETRTQVGSALFQCLKGIPKQAFKDAFTQWLHRLEKCVEAKGEYFEGLN